LDLAKPRCGAIDRLFITSCFQIFHISPAGQLARRNNTASIVPATTSGDARP
jgi:hypothetical protein